MGFSVSASFAVAAIAGLIALSLLYPAVSTGFEQVTEAEQDAGERRLNALNTDINVTRACVDGATNRLEVDVENVGATELGVDRTHVLVNNDYQLTAVSRSVDGNPNTGVWAPGQTLELVYDVSGQRIIESIPVDPGRVTVATEHGVRSSKGVGAC